MAKKRTLKCTEYLCKPTFVVTLMVLKRQYLTNFGLKRIPIKRERVIKVYAAAGKHALIFNNNKTVL